MLFSIQKKLLFLSLLFFVACGQEEKSKDTSVLFDEYENIIQYADGVVVKQFDGITLVQIKNPWNENEILSDFVLCPDSVDVPQTLQNKTIIQTPVKSLITLSSTQWSPLIPLNSIDLVKGVSEGNFITDTIMKQRIASGKTIEVATESAFNVEKMIQLSSDLILYSPYPGGIPEDLKRVGAVLFPWSDYFESHPLGRAEWLRILGLLIGKQKQADEWFSDIENRYDSLKMLTEIVEVKPIVFSDKAFNGQWYVPGGKSYIAKLFEDSGADYVWKDNQSKASFPVDAEAIVYKAQDAEFWRIAANASKDYSYQDLLKENELHASFRAFKEKKVLFCNISETGYFEKAQYEPDVMLADFLFCFHSELLPDYQPVYYKLLK